MPHRSDSQPTGSAPPPPGEVTRLLSRWSGGDASALDRLLPAVYDELRQLAAAYLRRERSTHTLETGALVHEAFLRLLGQEDVDWNNRRHFFGIAAQAMRRILVDHARARLYAKRGGGAQVLSLDGTIDVPLERAPELIALDDALEDLATIDAEQASIVELRYFGGLSNDEVAELLGTSARTVTRRWRMARAWLYDTLIRESEHVP